MARTRCPRGCRSTPAADNLLLVPELTNALTDDAGELARVRALFAGCGQFRAVDLDAVIELQFRLAASDAVSPDPIVGRLEAAAEAVWRTLTPETAAAYARSLAPLIRQARADERRGTPASQSADEELPERFGPYVVEKALGRGADGMAYLAHHEDRDEVATVKYPAHGDGTVL